MGREARERRRQPAQASLLLEGLSTPAQQIVIEELALAFQGVTRKGGTSWTEAAVIDNYGSEEQMARARAEDRDMRWQEVALDPTWSGATSWGSEWSFLDPIGYRYYLPAALVSFVRKPNPETSLVYSINPDSDYSLEQQSLLTAEQRASVARALRYLAYEELKVYSESEWVEPYIAYWHQFDPDRDPAGRPVFPNSEDEWSED